MSNAAASTSPVVVKSATKAAAVANPSTKYDGKNKGLGLGYTHDLSKRTTLYTFVSQLKYDNNTGSTNDWVGGIATAGEKTNTFSAGIRHQF